MRHLLSLDQEKLKNYLKDNHFDFFQTKFNNLYSQYLEILLDFKINDSCKSKDIISIIRNPEIRNDSFYFEFEFIGTLKSGIKVDSFGNVKLLKLKYNKQSKKCFYKYYKVSSVLPIATFYDLFDKIDLPQELRETKTTREFITRVYIKSKELFEDLIPIYMRSKEYGLLLENLIKHSAFLQLFKLYGTDLSKKLNIISPREHLDFKYTEEFCDYLELITNTEKKQHFMILDYFSLVIRNYSTKLFKPERIREDFEVEIVSILKSLTIKKKGVNIIDYDAFREFFESLSKKMKNSLKTINRMQKIFDDSKETLNEKDLLEVAKIIQSLKKEFDSGSRNEWIIKYGLGSSQMLHNGLLEFLDEFTEMIDGKEVYNHKKLKKLKEDIEYTFVFEF